MSKSNNAGSGLAPTIASARDRNCSSDLKGLSVLVIGGDRRRFAIRQIKDQLGLKDVVWLPTRESSPSGKAFVHAIKHGRPDIVIVLTGLMRHQHLRDIKNACRSYGTTFIPLRRSLSAAKVVDAWENHLFSR